MDETIWMNEPSDAQVEFAEAIAETIGEDLPDEYTASAYWEFINENQDYFYEVRRDIRREKMRSLGWR